MNFSNRSRRSRPKGEASVIPIGSNPRWSAFCFIFSVSVIGVIIHNQGEVLSKGLQSVVCAVSISARERITN